MPVSNGETDRYATDTSGEPVEGSIPAAYQAEIAALLALLVAALTPPVGAAALAAWIAALPLGLSRFRVTVAARLDVLIREVAVIADATITAVSRRAYASAAVDFRWRGILPDVDPRRAVELTEALRSANPRIVHTLAATYRQAMEAVARGGADPRVIVQRILDDLANRGVTGYIDSAGRNWSLEAYVETVVRSHLSDAAFASYQQVMLDAGIRFAQVYGAPGQGCARVCHRWSSRIVSIDGTPAGTYRVRVGRRERTITVMGTAAQARREGLWHPWCQHPMGPVIGGTRRAPIPRVDRVARAERRYRGRYARAWDRRTTVAMSRQARAQAAERSHRWRRITRQGRGG